MYIVKASFIRDLIQVSISLGVHRKKRNDIRLVQASRNCAYDNLMRIEFFVGVKEKLDVSEYEDYKNGDVLRFPNKHIRIHLPVASNDNRFEFIAGTG